MTQESAQRRDYGVAGLFRALPFLVGVGGLALAYRVLTLYVDKGWLLADAHAYWLTGQEGFAGYDSAPGALDAYLYSPAFAQVLSVVTWLPWPAFALGWLGLQLGVLVWLVRPLGWLWATVAVVWCVPELALGNIWTLIAASVVMALRGHPQAWAFPILTKPVLGIGVLWHLTRREWRSVAVAAITTATVVLVSALIDPEMWRDWLDFLRGQSSSGWFTARLVTAIGMVVFAARTDRRWLLPVALLLAVPNVGGNSVLVLLVAIPRLLGNSTAAKR